MKQKYWLMKSEPEVYGIEDLAREGVTGWEGVRNYQARNFMRDEMKVGDYAIFYHSNASPPGAVGIMEVVREAYPDETAEDPESKYFEPRVRQGKNPNWVKVDLKYVETFDRLVSLKEMKMEPKLANMLVIRRGMRLSIQPVTKEDFVQVCCLGGLKSSFVRSIMIE